MKQVCVMVLLQLTENQNVHSQLPHSSCSLSITDTVTTAAADHANDSADPNCKARRQTSGHLRRVFDYLESLSPLWVHDKLFRAMFVNIPEVHVQLSIPPPPPPTPFGITMRAGELSF